MGIEKLWETIKEIDCARTVSLSDLFGLIKTDHCRIAIDTAWLASSHFRGQWSGMIKSNRTNIDGLVGISIKTLLDVDARLKRYGFETVWCLDGDRSQHKLATGKRIGEKDKKMRVVVKRYMICKQLLKEAGRDESMLDGFSFVETQLHLLDDDVVVEIPDATITEHINEIKKALLYCALVPPDFMNRVKTAFASNGVQMLRVPSISEGEKLACILIQQGYCQAVYCNDGDSIVLGARCIIKSIDGNMATIYRYQDIITKLEMNHRELLYFCIMCGCDFNTHVEGIGAVKARKLLNNEEFDIYEFNQQNFGCLRINRCIIELTISEKDHEDTLAELIKVTGSTKTVTRLSDFTSIIGGDDDECIVP